jgi:uncharacterized repeat protein (TIGR02543 family)
MPLKSTIFIIATITALFAGMSDAAVKNVAVVETDVDARSGAVELNRAEISLITTEIRREAVENLPRGAYNIMTSETVQAQGGAILEECAEENCVIALGSKIGADYIVRGTMSKLGAKFTLSVEMYETENGNLVALSKSVKSENIEELIEKAGVVCAEMFKAFANAQNGATIPVPAVTTTTPTAAIAPITYTLTVNANPADGGFVYRDPDKESYSANERVTVTVIPYNGYKFTGWTGSITSKKTTVTGKMDGDKALTANFTKESGMVDRQAAGVAGTEAPEYEYKIRKFDWYFIPKYQLPMVAPSSWGGVNVEGGFIWGKGAFLGVDISYAIDGYSGPPNGMVGFGLGLGNVYELGNELQLVYGGAIGLWGIEEDDGEGIDFLAPFIKLRSKGFELTYRGLLGWYRYRSVIVDEGFGWNSHQLMLGLYFATSKRGTPKKVKVRRASPALPDGRYYR